MYKFPKTERGLRSRISAYRNSLKAEKRRFGFFDDGYGKRYILFWLYFVLGDLKESQTYIRWYNKNFEDDIGEPVHKLCNALIHFRFGKTDKAKYLLADLMLSNLYIIPIVIGKEIKRHKIRFGSNYADYEYAEETPIEVQNSITDKEKDWLREMYESMEFHRYRKQYIEIHEQLENTEGVENRSPLVREAGELLNDLKAHCS
jgi:hypothetical protein